MWAVLNNYHYSIHFPNTFKWTSSGIYLVFIKVAASRYVCMFTKPCCCEISCTLLPYPSYISMFICKHTHTYICAHTHIHIHTRMHMNIIYAHIYIHTFVYAHTYIHTIWYKHIHTDLHINLYIHISWIYTCIFTIRTHNMHAHTCTQTLLQITCNQTFIRINKIQMCFSTLYYEKDVQYAEGSTIISILGEHDIWRKF